MPSERRPYIAEIGADAFVRRNDGSRINFGDAIYHPENADEARAYAADSHSGVPVEGLAAAVTKLVEQGPHWSPHPDIVDRVPRDVEWGASLVAVADLRSALAAAPREASEPK